MGLNRVRQRLFAALPPEIPVHPPFAPYPGHNRSPRMPLLRTDAETTPTIQAFYDAKGSVSVRRVGAVANVLMSLPNEEACSHGWARGDGSIESPWEETPRRDPQTRCTSQRASRGMGPKHVRPSWRLPTRVVFPILPALNEKSNNREAPSRRRTCGARLPPLSIHRQRLAHVAGNLLHRDGLGQIAGLIDVAAAPHG